jgi:hypothetical protein
MNCIFDFDLEPSKGADIKKINKKIVPTKRTFQNNNSKLELKDEFRSDQIQININQDVINEDYHPNYVDCTDKSDFF